jgi:hypothetical protein
MARPFFVGVVCVGLAAALDLTAPFRGDRDVSVIGYAVRPEHNVISELKAKLRDGTVRLAFEGTSGYLRSTLRALNVPVESQLVVFSKTSSAQGPKDSQGRSLRQFDLERRIMRYPCSYMIYAPAFDALPAGLNEAVPAPIASFRRRNARCFRRPTGGRWLTSYARPRKTCQNIFKPPRAKEGQVGGLPFD